MTNIFPRLALSLAALAAAGHGWAAPSMPEAQAKAYFAGARLVSQGAMDGSPATAVLMPNADSDSARLELWRRTDNGFELTASAPKAGCLDCSGPSHKPNPSSLSIASGVLEVEYQGGGAGAGFWAWRSSWSWDPTLSALRALSTQRIGSDAKGSAHHAIVNFVAGTRVARLVDDDGSIKSTSCRAAVARSPSIAQLSLPALFDGSLEPSCQSGTETGDPLAASPTPGSNALDNMMRASAPKPR